MSTWPPTNIYLLCLFLSALVPRSALSTTHFSHPDSVILLVFSLKWLNSYLHDRSQIVHIGSVSSSPVSITAGVPQGSVLGHILCTLYISPIGQIAASHGLSHQQYADDTQLFISVCASNPSASVSLLNSCLSGLHYWFSVHGMSLNPSKSEAILFGTHQRLRTYPNLPSVELDDTGLNLSNKM